MSEPETLTEMMLLGVHSEKPDSTISVAAFSLDSHCYLQCCYFLLTSIQVDYQSAEYLLQMPLVEQRYSCVPRVTIHGLEIVSYEHQEIGPWNRRRRNCGYGVRCRIHHQRYPRRRR
jgi:hypothetical protein